MKTDTTPISMKVAQKYANELATYTSRCDACGVAENHFHAAECYFLKKSIKIGEETNEAA